MTGVNYLQLAQDVVDGEESALKALGILKTMEKDLKQCIEMVMPEALEEAQGWGEKSFTTQGFIFEVRDGSRRHDFKHIPEWADLKGKMTLIEGAAKDAARAAESGKQTVTEDGEVVTPAKVTFTKASITVKAAT